MCDGTGVHNPVVTMKVGTEIPRLVTLTVIYLQVEIESSLANNLSRLANIRILRCSN